MSMVFIRVWTQIPGGSIGRLSHSAPAREEDAHDVLRDALHAVGVSNPDKAIEGGWPVPDAAGTYMVHWKVEECRTARALVSAEAEVQKHGSLAAAIDHWVGELSLQCDVLETTDGDPELSVLLMCLDLMSLAAEKLSAKEEL